MANSFGGGAYAKIRKSERKKRLKQASQAYTQALANSMLGLGQPGSGPFSGTGMGSAGINAGIGGTPPPTQDTAATIRRNLAATAASSLGGPGTSSLYNSIGPGSSGGGGGGGGSTGGGGAMQSLPMDPMSGFAGNYTGLGLDILYSNPEILARDSLKGMGINPNSGMYQLAEDQARNLQFLAMLGMGTGDENSITPENYLNFANQYYKDMMSRGQSPDVWGMIGSLLNSPEGSALQAYLTDGTPQDQAQAFNTLVNVATASLPPVFRKAIMAKMEDQTSDWLSQQAKGDTSSSIIADFIKPGGLLG